jgi:hypothetical protein
MDRTKFEFVVQIKSLRTGTLEDRTVPSTGGVSFSLGSGADQDLRLPGIASKHAVLTQRGMHTMLEPEPGESVTFLGQSATAERRVDSEPFTVGDYELRVVFRRR